MVAQELDFSFKVEAPGGSQTIYRMNKDGAFEPVETQNSDYKPVNEGEKLVMIMGMSKPYEIDGQEKDKVTGEVKKVKVKMIKWELGILNGRLKGQRILLSIGMRVTAGTNSGKMLAAILKDEFRVDGDFPPQKIMRKPFFINTENEVKDGYTNVKFVSARAYDPDLDDPIEGATVTPIPQPKPVTAPAAVDADALFNEDL